jgi:pimeloyl-ACP methyl ester carboxylesterase
MPGTETILLQRRLRAAGFEPRLFRFRTVSVGLDENVERLAAFVAAIPGGAHLIGYSLGGVLAVCLGARPDAPALGRIVCLGAPLNGSGAGRRLARTALGRRLLGKSMLELNARAPLPEWSGTPALGVIAGRLGVGVGRLLGGFALPNDGTVAVEETRLAGLTDHLVLPVSHPTLLFSRAVARHAAEFLEHGHF